jgi:hypothetical protein
VQSTSFRSTIAFLMQVKLRIYCCGCPVKHTMHFSGEALGLYAWTRGILVTQASCQLLLRSVQKSGSVFGGIVSAQNAARRHFKPNAVLLSEETWRRASLNFFRLCGRQILECCSLCGPHPEVSSSPLHIQLGGSSVCLYRDAKAVNFGILLTDNLLDHTRCISAEARNAE